MVKDDIINLVHKRVGFARNEAAHAVEVLFDTIKMRLMSGEDVNIVGFGKFCLRDKKERIGRNPKTGQEFTISARRVLTFKPSKYLKEMVNQK
jgi:integration host factor subunit alpha